MGEIIGTAIVVLLLAAGVFLAGRKLWRDKKNGRTCCRRQRLLHLLR